MIRHAAALALLLLLAACGLPGNVVVLMPDEDGHVGRVMVANDLGHSELDKPLTAIGLKPGDAPSQPFDAKPQQVNEAFAGAMAAKPRAVVKFTIYFAAGGVEVDPASSADLARAIEAAKTTPNLDISVVGHADATGSDTINLDLSLRRAEAIRDQLVAAGVKAGVIDLTSHGANNPLVPTAQGVAEPRNRRVEITLR